MRALVLGYRVVSDAADGLNGCGYSAAVGVSLGLSIPLPHTHTRPTASTAPTPDPHNHHPAHRVDQQPRKARKPTTN